MRNPCCEFADMIEYTSVDGQTLIATECPCCGHVEASDAWNRLSEKVQKELSPRRPMAVSA